MRGLDTPPRQDKVGGGGVFLASWAGGKSPHHTHNPGMLGLLLKEGPDDLFDYCLLTMPLTAKRAIACTNAALRARIARLSSPVLYVRKEDATFENAQFVARLPGLTTVFVEGETTLPAGLEVARLRDVALN